MNIDEKMLEMLLSVERSVAVLSGYVRGLLLREHTEPIITINESEVIESEKNYLSVATDTKEVQKIVVDFDFTKKELTKMKKEFVKHYTQNGLVLNVRAKGNVYEIRYRRDGLNLSASSKVLNEAKEKMRTLIKQAYREEPSQPKPNKKTAIEYFLWYIKEVKRPKSNAQYCDYLTGYVNNHLRAVFGDKYFPDVPFCDLQKMINGYIEKGKYRTASGLRTLMIEVYKSAVYDGEVKVNHAARISPIVYEQKHGRKLSIEEEKQAIDAIFKCNNPHRNDLFIMLFTGLRPCELKSLSYLGEFLVVKCAKVRTGKTKYRKIPMSPMFKKYVDTSIPPFRGTTKAISKAFASVLPGINPYDFRHTFITRAQECGVPRPVVQYLVGQSDGSIMEKHYTEYSDEYLLKMALLINY